MNAIVDWLDDVPNAPLWLAVITVLGAGILVAIASRLTRRSVSKVPRPRAGRYRDADAEVDLGRPVMEDDLYQQGSRSERRSAPRRGGNPIAVLISDAAAEVEPVHGWILDRSIGGLGLELIEEGQVDVGTILSIRPAQGPVVPWVKIEVRTCRKVPDGWRLGCQFVRPPSSDIQLRFG